MTEFEQQLLQLLQRQAEQLTELSLSHAQTTKEILKLSQQQSALTAQQAEICALLKTEQRLPQEILKQTSEHLAALSTQQKQTSEHLAALSTHQQISSTQLNQVLQALAKPQDNGALQQALSESLGPLRESLQKFAQLIEDRL